MIDSNSSGQEQDRMCPEGRVVTPFLPHREWSEDEVLELAESTLGIDCTGAETVDFDTDDVISMQLDHLLLADGSEFQVWARTTIVFDYYQCPISLDQDEVGNVLANYKHGGLSAVDAYFESKETKAEEGANPLSVSTVKALVASIHSDTQQSDFEPEKGQCLAASDPSLNDHTDTYEEAGNQND